MTPEASLPPGTDDPALDTTAAGDMSAYTGDPAMLADFIVEVREDLNVVEEKILRLERNGTDPADIHAAFRVFHTIKGLASFLELKDIQEVAHEIETLLDLGRSGRLADVSRIADVVLQSMDFIRGEANRLETESIEGQSTADASSESRHNPVSASAVVAEIRAAAASRVSAKPASDTDPEDLPRSPPHTRFRCPSSPIPVRRLRNPPAPHPSAWRRQSSTIS